MGIIQAITERILQLFQGNNWLVIPAALLTVVFHEISHGYVAYFLGDNTAKNAKRLSLNPLRHIDLIGLLCMIIFRFGWAKPVPINIMNFKNRKAGTALVSIAGPLSNILFALVSFLLIKLLLIIPIYSEFAFSVIDLFVSFFVMTASLNIGLAVFNLLPIPPLDGSKILNSVLPDKIYYKILKYEQYGFLILILLLNFPPFENLINIITGWIYKGFYSLIF